MEKFFSEFQSTITLASAQLSLISEADSSIPIAPGKWSRKEIIGHLIDSASNNHQRFVRAQLTNMLELPGYQQAAWVSAQQYQEIPWQQLVALWQHYNLHLLHVARRFPTEKLQTPCRIGGSEPLTIQFIIVDYLTHLQHHLKQVIV